MEVKCMISSADYRQSDLFKNKPLLYMNLEIDFFAVIFKNILLG